MNTRYILIDRKKTNALGSKGQRWIVWEKFGGEIKCTWTTKKAAMNWISEHQEYFRTYRHLTVFDGFAA